MRNRTIFVLSFFMCVTLVAGRDALAITKQEVITLAQLGISPDEIIKAIEKDRTIFKLEINDILELKNAGVPEAVIRFMLATPQRYGSEGPKEVDKQPEKQPEKTVEEKTPEEIKAEAERARLEAQRLKDEQDKALAAQRKAFAQTQMKDGLDMANEGKYVQAIRHFQKFIEDNNLTAESDEYYSATYGMALALVKAGLYRTAADTLVEVVLLGPDKPFFHDAFLALTDMRRKVEFFPPELEQLSRFFVGNFSKTFQDRYNYFLGQFFYEAGNPSLALKYFEQVSDGASDYARTLYLRGIIQVNNEMYKTAVQSFQQAILAQEKNKSDERISHLAYLALARIAYQIGDYDASIYYYRRVPKDSMLLPTAFYESSWCFFVKGDYSRALGTFHAMHSPYFAHYFYPELWILEATVFLNMCRYDYAKQAIDMFRRHISVQAVPLRQFMQSMRTPVEYYMAVTKIMEGDRSYNLPEVLIYPVLSNMDFYSRYKSIKQIDWELKELRNATASLGTWAEERIARLESEKIGKMNDIGIWIQTILKSVESDLKEYEVKVTEIELDLNQVEMEKIEIQTRMLMMKEQIDRAMQRLTTMAKKNAPADQMLEAIKKDAGTYSQLKSEHIESLEKAGIPEKVIGVLEELAGLKNVGGGSVAIVGSDSLEWPFEGEYWSDELWGFRSFLKEECIK